MRKIKTVFLGTPDISVYFLERLKELGFVFDLIITNPDVKVGRKQVLTPSAVAVWAEKNKIDVLKPEKINQDLKEKLKKENYDLFFVLAYGKILPKDFLEIPPLGVLNLHPSLLPKYRGPSPIISAILDDQKFTGLSIMQLSEKMDAGDILIQENVLVDEWIKNDKLEKHFAEIGAERFFENLENIVDQKIKPQKQNEKEVTYCQKYQKKDMELSFPLTDYKNYLKYCAFSKPFFFDKKKKRVIVTKAKLENNQFVIEKIVKEGKKESDFNPKDFE